MVVLLHVSHFCCLLFYDYSSQSHELTEQSVFDDNGEGIEGTLLSGQAQRDVNRKKLPGELGQGEEGQGQGDIPSPFLFIRVLQFEPLATIFNLHVYLNAWSGRAETSINYPLVFILGRAVETSQISFPNLPSPDFVIHNLLHQVMIFSPNAYQQDKFRLNT